MMKRYFTNEKISLINLPENIYPPILLYLSVKDILNIRLTCCFLYKRCFCKEFFERIILQPRYIGIKNVSSLDKLLRGAGRYVKLNISRLQYNDIKLLTGHFKSIVDLSVDIIHLPIITEHCINLKQLELFDSNPFFFQKEGRANTFFDSVHLLSSLNKLTICGCNQAYPSLVLVNILENTKSITNLVLDSITINGHKKTHLKLKDAVFNANHIRHWTFSNILLLTKTNFILPPNVQSFQCFNSVITPLNEQHNEIEYLMIDGMVPYFTKIWKNNRFLKLKKLELKKAFFYHSRLETCVNLKTLILSDCHASFNYMINLSSVVALNLTTLSVSAYKGYDDQNVLKIIKKFTGLQYLTLINMAEITSMFLCYLVNSSLKKITLKNCQQFKSYIHKAQVDIFRNNSCIVIDIL